MPPTFSLVRITAALAAALLLAATVVCIPVAGQTAIHAAGIGSAALTAIGPTRIVDTRANGGFVRLSATTMRVIVAGRNGVPATATAAAISLSVKSAVAPGYLTAWPSGSAQPNASALNFERAQNVTNTLFVQLGEGGAIDVYSPVAVTTIIDVTGFFLAADASRAGRLIATTPTRVVDTRVDDVALPPSASLQVHLDQFIAPDAVAAMLTLTTTRPNGAGFLTAFATGAPRPKTPSLSIDRANTARSATVLVPLQSADVTIHSSAGGHVVVDLVGYFTGPGAPVAANGLFIPSAPERLIDTRGFKPLLPGGVALISTEPGVIVGNLTVTNATGSGFVTTYPSGSGPNGIYSLSVTDANQTVSNMTMTTSSPSGFTVQSNGGGHLIFDRTGRFVTDPEPVDNCTVSDLLVPSCGAWFGASTPSLDGTYNYPVGLGEYERAAQNTPDILHFYKRGASLFPTTAELKQSERPGRQRSLLMYNWKPSSELTWRQIADGAADTTIDQVAAGLNAYPHRFFLAIHHEPENDEGPSGSGMTAGDYVEMFRHVVTRLRVDGVTNAVFVMNYMGFSRWAPAVDRFYPGDDVVDWLAYDPYGFAAETNFALFLNSPTLEWSGFYTWATAKAPNKPIMLGEWGFDLRSQPNAGAILDAAPDIVASQFPLLKALVFWNNSTGAVQVRIDLPGLAQQGYREAFARMANHPYFNATSTQRAP